MKQKKIVSWLLAVLTLALCCVCFAACVDDEENNNYPVEGVWHAVATWQEETKFTLLGETHRIIDNYHIDFYFDFREDGAVMKKATITVNGYVMHTDNEEWNSLNVTWSVKGNVLTLSSGKQFVIVDDEFDDTYPAKNLLLRYKKEAEEPVSEESAAK